MFTVSRRLQTIASVLGTIFNSNGAPTLILTIPDKDMPARHCPAVHIQVINTAMYYMAGLVIQSVPKVTHADWLPSRAISFSYRLASFGGKISEYI